MQDTGICKDCGAEGALFGFSGLCTQCMAARSAQTRRANRDKRVHAPVVAPVEQKKSLSIIDKGPVKVKTRSNSKAVGVLEYLFGDDVVPITDEKSGENEGGLDSTWLVIGAGVALIVIYALYGDRLKGLIEKLTSKLGVGKPDNPYSAPVV